MEEKTKFIERVASILRSVYHVSDEVSYFIGCQFALESAYGRSPLAVNHHNYCGMKCPLVRVSVAENYRNQTDKWAYYLSLEQCICDFMFCLAYRKPKSTVFESVQEYTYFIKGWYCPENSYINKITNLFNQFKNGQIY